MDLQLYYRKIRDCVATIKEDFPVVISRETPDGGKAGILIEVPSRLAAKMIVDGAALLASPKDAMAFREKQAVAKRLADQEAAAARVQFTLVSADDLERLKGTTHSKG